MRNLLALCLLILLIWLALTFFKIHKNKQLDPGIAIVLSGDYDRIHYAVKYAKKNKSIPIWISGTESDLFSLEEILEQAKLPKERFTIKPCAVDTVTNFTCIVNELTQQRFKHILLITSDYHMQRAIFAGNIVLGSRKIAITSQVVSSELNQTEPKWKLTRDSFRAAAWVATGYIGPIKKLNAN